MKHITIITLHEIRANIQNYRLPVAAIILAVLMGISLLTLVKDHRQKMDDYVTLKQSQIPLLGLSRPSPLGIFANGLNELLQAPYRVNEFKQISSGESHKSVNPLFGAFAPPDMLYIIRIVLTLIAIFFTYDSITAEKEQGTLRICLAGAVPRRSFIIGKMVGGYLSLAVPAGLLLLSGFVFIAQLPDVNFTGGQIVRFLLFILSAMLFLAVFVSLGTTVSVVARSSGQSLVVLIGVWILIIYFIPSMTASLADSASPLPPTSEIDRELNCIWAGGVFTLLNLHDDGSFNAKDRQESNRDILEKTKNIESEFFGGVDRQIDKFQLLGRLSPATAFTNLSTALLQSGVDDYRDFRQVVLQRRNTIATDDKANAAWSPSGRLLRASLSSSLLDALELLLMAAALSLMAIVLFNKVDLT